MTKAMGRRISRILLKKAETNATNARYALDVALTQLRNAKRVHRKFSGN